MAAAGLIDTNPNSAYLPQQANITTPFHENERQAAYNDVVGGQNAQMAFVNQLQAQGGVGNQANVFNQQQQLASQLQQQAMGGGPNPALAQLAQTTGQNTQNQAALMAGQRGVGSNPGLASRQIAQAGMNAQQQAGGQAATMRAQQQLAAQGQLAGQQANMANLATNQVGQQQGALNAYNTSAQNVYGMGLNSMAQENAARVGMQSNVNNANSAYGVNDVTQGAKIGSSILGGAISGIAGAAAMAHGGQVQAPLPLPPPPPPITTDNISKGFKAALGFAEGGMINSIQPQQMSLLGQYQNSSAPINIGSAAQAPMDAGGGDPIGDAMKGPAGSIGKMIKGGGGLGESSMSSLPAAGGSGLEFAAMASKGGSVGGHANVSGDSPKNDTVPTMLSPGEVVIPRSITHDPQRIAHFLNGLLGISLSVGKAK